MSNDGKYAAEIQFWTEERDRYVHWYEGRMPEFYGVRKPSPSAKITRHANQRLNALETWVNADRWRYCKHLFLPPTYWSGRIVLEIGCGPLGLAQGFVGATLRGLDPLVPKYVELGYPLNSHRIRYLPNSAESIPLADNSVEAVFSVNAIDHVDDFAAACREIERVTRPAGEIRIEVHYHEATTTEPWVLNDEIVAGAFRKFRMRKIAESPSALFYPPGTHPRTDRFALWSNVDYLFDAVNALR